MATDNNSLTEPSADARPYPNNARYVAREAETYVPEHQHNMMMIRRRDKMILRCITCDQRSEVPLKRHG